MVSPTLNGGISKISFNCSNVFSEANGISLKLTITAEDGTVIETEVAFANDVASALCEFEYVLDTPIQGNFTIRIENNGPSNATKNKDRCAIWNLTWTSAPADEPETPDEPAANELTVTTTDNYCWIDVVEFTATVSGTYTFTLPAGLGAFDVDACDAWPPVGRPYADYYDNTDGATFSIELAAGETTRFYIGALTKQDWVITWTVVEGDVEGGETPDTPDEPVAGTTTVVLGNNDIVVTDALYTDGGFEATFTVAVEGDYKFSSNYLLVRIYNPMGMQLGTGSAYLTEGTYTLQIVTAYAPGAGTYGLEVELLAPVEPDEPDEPIVSGNPVIETLPFTYEITTGGNDTFDVYYDFTATADVTLVITRPEGALVSLSGDSNDWSNDENGNYVLFVPAGETVCLNFWTMNPAVVGSFTVSEQAATPLM